MKNAGGVRLPLPLAFGQFLGSLGVGVGKAARQRWAMMQTESTVPTRAWPAYGYLASILNNAECPAMIIGGVADHVHILFELSRQACVAGLVGDFESQFFQMVEGSRRGRICLAARLRMLLGQPIERV